MNDNDLKLFLLETIDAVETLARAFRTSIEGKPRPDGSRVVDAREVQAQLLASEQTLSDIASRLRAH